MEVAGIPKDSMTWGLTEEKVSGANSARGTWQKLPSWAVANAAGLYSNEEGFQTQWRGWHTAWKPFALNPARVVLQCSKLWCSPSSTWTPASPENLIPSSTTLALGCDPMQTLCIDFRIQRSLIGWWNSPVAAQVSHHVISHIEAPPKCEKANTVKDGIGDILSLWELVFWMGEVPSHCLGLYCNLYNSSGGFSVQGPMIKSTGRSRRRFEGWQFSVDLKNLVVTTLLPLQSQDNIWHRRGSSTAFSYVTAWLNFH